MVDSPPAENPTDKQTGDPPHEYIAEGPFPEHEGTEAPGSPLDPDPIPEIGTCSSCGVSLHQDEARVENDQGLVFCPEHYTPGS